MDRDPDNNGIKRRRLLQLMGAGLLAGAVPAGTAEAEKNYYPVYASGVRKHEYEPDPNSEDFIRTDKFVSSDLSDRNKKSDTVSSGSVVVPRESIPDEYKNPDRSVTTEYSDAGTFGSFDQHMNSEDDLKAYPTESSTGPPSDYKGPLFTYSSGDLDERTAPLNVSWYDTGYKSEGVKNEMLEEGWGSVYTLSTSKYIGYYDGTKYIRKTQDKHVKQESGLVPGEQWHGRLYDIPTSFYDGYEVVCAAHHDPADHGWLPGDQNWRFDDSRNKFLSTWEDIGYFTTTQYIDNGSDYDSSDGQLGIVY